MKLSDLILNLKTSLPTRGVRSLIFSTPTPTCVSKLDSCSWCDSWLNKIYWLLLLFNSCVTIFVDCEYVFKCLKHSAKNHSCSSSCSNQKYPLLVLLRLLPKNANSCRSRLLYSGSCTPLLPTDFLEIFNGNINSHLK